MRDRVGGRQAHSGRPPWGTEWAADRHTAGALHEGPSGRQTGTLRAPSTRDRSGQGGLTW
eukprot:350742-Chlamydomonas_euryale.AAC.12